MARVIFMCSGSEIFESLGETQIYGEHQWSVLFMKMEDAFAMKTAHLLRHLHVQLNLFQK